MFSSNSEFVKFWEVSSGGDWRLWMEVIYGRYRAKTRQNWNGKALISIGFFFMPVEGDLVLVPADNPLEPVPIILSSGSSNYLSHEANGMKYYAGNYNLARYVRCKQMDTHALVLTCNFQTEDEEPLSDIKILATEEQINEKGEKKKVIVVPTGYQFLNYPLGRHSDRYIVYKKQGENIQILYKPEFIEKFPRNDYPDFQLPQAIQMFCFPEGVQLVEEQPTASVFSFVLTIVQEKTSIVNREYVTCLIFYEHISEALRKKLHVKVSETRKVYVPKAICLVSQWPFIDQYREILKEIYRLHLSTYDVPIERVICNLVEEVPVPDQGYTTVQYEIGREKIYFSRPPPKHLPYASDKCFEMLFRSLRIPDVIQVWTAVMIERKILLISRHKALLTYVAMALTALIYPFKWENPFIPVLPTPLGDYIQAILPYILGVTPQTLKNLEVPEDAIKVDLDSGTVTMQEPLPRLPSKPLRQLVARLSDCADIYSPNDPVRETIDEAFNFIYYDNTDHAAQFHGLTVRDSFLEFQSLLMKNYHRFFVMPNSSNKFTKCEDCFNFKGFLSYHKADKKDYFLFQVTATQLFAQFIENRFFNKQVQQEIIYFDEAMKFKRTKTDPCFVKPYFAREVSPALTASDVGLEAGYMYHYDTFPKLDDTLFCEPRQIHKLGVSQTTKPTLLFRDETLHKMSQGEWAKFLMDTIYKIWFIMFAPTIPRYCECANQLIDLAVYIMDSMKKKGIKPDEEIYRKLIEACGYCGLRDKLHLLFKRMKNQGIEPDACTHGVYVRAVGEGQFSKKKATDQVLGLADLDANSICLTLNSDECVFLPEDECPDCLNATTLIEMLEGLERSYSEYTITCPLRHKFAPKLHIILHAECRGNDNYKEVLFVSPPVLRKELENVTYLHGEDALSSKNFVDKFPMQYWNMLMYFNLISLPTFFLNPTFDPARLPSVIVEAMKENRPRTPSRSPTPDRPRMHTARSISGVSMDDLSDVSSQLSGMSGYSNYSSASYSGAVSNKFQNLVYGRSHSRKSSNCSDNASTRSSSKNNSIKKLFSPYVKEFLNVNRMKGMEGPLIERMYPMEMSDPMSPGSPSQYTS
jgi:pentatricopeptide repeat protein